MKSITELYGRHPGSDIYILGTGASVRVFPLSLLDGRIVIGLNMAWKLYPVRYCLTIRAELNVPEFMPGESPRPEIDWILKYDKLIEPEHRALVDSQPDRFYHFSTKGKPCNLPKDQPSQTGRMPEWVRQPTDDKLYLWSSVSQSAANLAANMGAKNIFLIGCDNCSLAGNHHAHDQHVFWKGESPDVRYKQYEEGCAEVREALRQRGVNLVSLTPFVSLRDPASDFERMCNELDCPTFIHNDDITTQQAQHDSRFRRVLNRMRRALRGKPSQAA